MDEAAYRSAMSALLHGADRLTHMVENVLLLTQIDLGELAGFDSFRQIDRHKQGQ
jgi:hypothetical protein